MGPISAHFHIGDAALPTCGGRNSRKFKSKLWLLLCLVSPLATFGGVLLSAYGAHGGSGAANEAVESSSVTESEKIAEAATESGSGPQKAEAPSETSGLLRGAKEDNILGKETTKCTPTDVNTIFWRTSGDSGEVEEQQSTDTKEEGKGDTQRILHPSNPFYHLLLTCGQTTFAIVEHTKPCVQSGLQQMQKEPLTETCIDCFMDSVQCGAQQCRFACFPNPCAESCIECNSTTCRPMLNQCTGLSQLPPLCVEGGEGISLFKQEEEETPTEMEGWSQIYAGLGISHEDDAD